MKYKCYPLSRIIINKVYTVTILVSILKAIASHLNTLTIIVSIVLIIVLIMYECIYIYIYTILAKLSVCVCVCVSRRISRKRNPFSVRKTTGDKVGQRA